MVDLLDVGGVLLALALVLLNGFFVAAEFALVRVRGTSVESLVEEGASGAFRLEAILDSLDDYLAVTQLGITLSSLGLGWVGEPAVASLIEPVVEPFLPTAGVHLVAFALGFGFITFLHVVFGELAPKTIAIAQAERISLLVAGPMRFFYLLFWPGIVLFNGTANYFTTLLGVPPAHEATETLSEDELLLTLRRSSQRGKVERSEVELIERVFDLDDIPAREIIIPRPDVVSVAPDADLEALRDIVSEAGHTRYPVVAPDDPGRIVGLIDVKDLFVAGDDPDVTAADLSRDLAIVPESQPIDDLLRTMQREQVQIVAVVDEWGAFEGIATIEDIVEELVGDIRDAFDATREDRSIEQRPDGTYQADGAMSLDRLNETLGTEFDLPGYGTVAGLAIDALGREPHEGDVVDLDGVRVTVLAVDGMRIEAVEIERLSDEE
ncbi:MAG: hemolysin family protein [Halobacteriota archaeon]